VHRNVASIVKWSRYRPGVAQRVGTGIAVLFHDRGTRRGWVVSSTPRLHFTPWKDPVPILQEAGWVPGPVWTGGKSRPHRDSIPDRPARSQSLYRLSYRTTMYQCVRFILFWNDTLHVSDGLSVHHQQFKTVHTATGFCQTDTAICLLASRQQCLFDCCCMYSLELLIMDGKTVRNM